MTPTQIVALIKKSHLSRNMDAISIINVIYKVTDYSNQSPIGKDEINNKYHFALTKGNTKKEKNGFICLLLW